LNSMKIGLVGTGHLGKIHLKCLLATECWNLVGFYDPDDKNAAAVAAQFGLRRFETYVELLDAVDAVDIVTPTPVHFQMASEAMVRGKHVFVEKPVTETVAEGRELLRLAAEHRVTVQVGHVERFNPAYLALQGMSLRPMFIEAHRLAAFQPRGTEVSVVLDLMIHDLDLVLHLVQSPLKNVSASGVAVLSNTPDIANARLEFENGAVANLTASRISLKQMRKMRLFQPDHYLSLDFLEKNAQIIRLYEPNDPDLPPVDDLMEFDTQQGKKWLQLKMADSMPVNAIQMELETFHDSVLHGTTPRVTLQSGLEALEAAHWVLAEIEKGLKKSV
jgi:predicted dehydrogenase